MPSEKVKELFCNELAGKAWIQNSKIEKWKKRKERELKNQCSSLSFCKNSIQYIELSSVLQRDASFSKNRALLSENKKYHCSECNQWKDASEMVYYGDNMPDCLCRECQRKHKSR